MARNRRGGYSGSSTFTFTVDRFLDKNTGEYLLEQDIPESISDEEFSSRFEFKELDLEVSGSSWYNPGYTSGPPEDCYPDEGDTEIDSVIGPDGEDFYDLLTSKEVEDITSQLDKNCQDSD